MKYQLILQWPTSKLDYDAMIAIEELVMAEFTGDHVVDGHDAGSGEMNVFILTDDPLGAFREVRSILGAHPAWPGLRAAYRDLDEEGFTIVWPKGLASFDIA